MLVHLGIDTVQLKGEGFTLLAAEGDDVEAGAPVVEWDPAAVEAGGRSPVCPVVANADPASFGWGWGGLFAMLLRFFFGSITLSPAGPGPCPGELNDFSVNAGPASFGWSWGLFTMLLRLFPGIITLSPSHGACVSKLDDFSVNARPASFDTILLRRFL